MSVTTAVDILQRKQRLAKTPLHLVVLGDLLVATVVIVLAWSTIPEALKSDALASFVIIAAFGLYCVGKNSFTRRRLELAELKILVLERERENTVSPNS